MLSVEHGVIWPPASPNTSMKAGVNSADACRANRLLLDYCRDLRAATPKIPQISSPSAAVYQLTPPSRASFISLAALPPWPFIVFSSA